MDTSTSTARATRHALGVATAFILMFGWSNSAFYTVNCQMAGYASSTMWSQPESFYVQVLAAPPRPPMIEAPQRSGDSFSVQIATTTGFTYYLEYKSNLAAPSWNAATQVLGNGTVSTLTDNTATNSWRVYRARAQ